MDQKVVTIILGLAGIIATLISSGLGLFFVAKARSAPLREALFKKQIDLISRIIHKQGRIRVYLSILLDENNQFKNKAREDVGECVREFSEMQEEAAAILPIELYSDVKHLNDYAIDLLVSYDEKKLIDHDNLITLSAMATKVAVISRALIGVEEFTAESLRLFSKKEQYDSLTKIEIEQFKKISK